MDCEKYDKIALDLLYDELDELTAAAAKRHLDQCARCREIHLKLRATREVGVLPLADVPPGFTERVLAAERLVSRKLPLPQRAARALTILAGYAMRPQLAMAALLLLMIGSSLVFLRARPGERSTVMVTERGMPETDTDSVILPSAKKAEQVTVAPAPAPTVVANQEGSSQGLGDKQGVAAEPATKSARAKSAVAANEYEARREAPASPAGGMAAPAADMAARDDALGMGSAEEKSPADAALQRAKDLQQSSGCSAAAPKFEEVSTRYPGTGAANEALWRAAECRRLLGDLGAARQAYTLLLDVSSYHDRAAAALKQLGKDAPSAELAASKPAASEPRSAAAAAPAAPPAKAKSGASGSSR
ncbi:MAG TPA: hypothetical protein VL137_10765 [Polyangiaceae bacterium]|jgi:hypothetical protein|nr:hypothetical protein [Polyangiaceae bacterium]